MIENLTPLVSPSLLESEEHLLLLMRLETLGLATVAELKAYEPMVDVCGILRDLEVSDLVFCREQREPTIAEISCVPPQEPVAPLLHRRDTYTLRCTRAAGRLLDDLGLQRLTLAAFARSVGGELSTASGFLDLIARYRSRNYTGYLVSAWIVRRLQTHIATDTPAEVRRSRDAERCAPSLLMLRLRTWLRRDRGSWSFFESLDTRLKCMLQCHIDRIESADTPCDDCRRHLAAVADTWPTSHESGDDFASINEILGSLRRCGTSDLSDVPVYRRTTATLHVAAADLAEDSQAGFDWTDEVVCAVISGEFRRAYEVCRSSFAMPAAQAGRDRLLVALRAFGDDFREVTPTLIGEFDAFVGWLGKLRPHPVESSAADGSPFITMAYRRLYPRLALLARAELERSIDLGNTACDEALERAARAIDDLDAVEALLRSKGVETDANLSKWLRSQLRASMQVRNGGE